MPVHAVLRNRPNGLHERLLTIIRYAAERADDLLDRRQRPTAVIDLTLDCSVYRHHGGVIQVESHADPLHACGDKSDAQVDGGAWSSMSSTRRMSTPLCIDSVSAGPRVDAWTRRIRISWSCCGHGWRSCPADMSSSAALTAAG